jgi:hypothetical protein
MRSDEVTVPFRPPADSPAGLGTWRRAVARAGDAYAQGRLDKLYRVCIAEVTKLSGTTNLRTACSARHLDTRSTVMAGWMASTCCRAST